MGSFVNGGGGFINAVSDLIASANTWTALQTFNAGITGGGSLGTLTAGTGILGTANSWTAVQTFGNNISIGGATFLITALATNNILQYNGTNWINVVATSVGAVTSVFTRTGAVVAVNTDYASAGLSGTSLTGTYNIGGTPTLTATLALNSQTLSGTGTFSGTIAFTATSPFSVANAQTLTVSVTAQTTGASTLTIPNFAGVADTFAFITLAQTLSNKTIASPVFSGSATGTYTLAGTPTLGANLALSGGRDIAAATNTLQAFRVTDGTNAYVTVDTRNTVTGVQSIVLATANIGPTIVSASGVTYSIVGISGVTLTLTGTTTVTAINGLGLNMGAPAITDSSAVIVTTASTLYITGAPTATGSVTITNAYALHVAAGISFFAGAVTFGGAITGGTANTIPKFSTTAGIANSAISDNGTDVTIASEHLIFTGAVGMPAANAMGNDASGNIRVNAVSGKIVELDVANAQSAQFSATASQFLLCNTYNNISTAALGFPVCVATMATTSFTSAQTNSINFTPPAAVGDYIIVVEVDITTSTTHSFSANVTFKDAGGTARTVVMSGFSPIGSSLTTGLITNVTGAGVYSLVAFMFSIDNSATAITLSTVGTFTTVTYTLGARLYRL